MLRPNFSRVLAGSIAALCATLISLPSAARAQSPYTWTSSVTGAGPHNWNADANWSGTGFPGNAAGAPGAPQDVAILTANFTAATVINLNAEITLGSLSINDTGPTPDAAITLGAGTGGSLIFDASTGNATFTNGSDSGGNSISAPVTLTDSLDVTATNSFSLTGVVSGAGTINKAGAGNMTLSNNGNSFDGGVALNTGGLFLHAGGALGSGNLVINGGTLGNNQTGTAVTLSTVNAQSWNGNFTFGGQSSLNTGLGAVTMNGSRSIAIGSTSDTLTIGGAIGGPAGASLTTTNVTPNLSTGIFALSGANTYDGGTFINGGVVRFNSNAAIPATGTITVQTGGALSASGAISTLADWLAEARLSTASTGALSLAGNSSELFNPGASGFQSLGLGANVGGSFTYTGTYTPGTNGYYLGGGGGTLILPDANVVTGANALTIGNGGGGTVIFSEENDLSGAVTISPGATLQLGAGGTTGNLNSASEIANQSTLLINRSAAVTVDAPLAGSGMLGIRGAGTVTFTNPASTQGGINQAVTGNYAMNVENLTLDGGSGGNTIVVGNLVPDGSSSSLTIGSAAGPGTGTLSVDSPANDIFVGQNGANNGSNPVPIAVLNLSDLGSFSATINDFRIATAGRSIGQVTLAAGTNTITADTILVATQAQTGTVGSFLRLGQTNTLNAASIAVSGGRTSATLEFVSGLTGTPTVKIRGKAGGETRANLVIADQTNASNGSGGGTGGSTDPTGIVDLTRGSVDAMLGNLIIGIGGSEASANIGAGRGTLTFDEGTIDATSVVVGRANLVTGGGAISNDSAAGTLNVDGTATLLAGSLSIAENNDSASGASPGANGQATLSGGTTTVSGNLTLASHSNASLVAGMATLNVSGGVLNVGGNVIAATHTAGTATAAVRTANVNLSGGVTTIEGNFNEGGGTTANNISNLLLNGGTLDLTGGNLFVDTFTAESGTLRNVGQLGTANGNGTGTTAPLTKTGSGTLILAGTNTYAGQTNVTAGTVRVDGSISGSVAVSNAGSTLGGVGTIGGNVVLGSATILAPGGSAGILTVAGSTEFEVDAIFAVEINGSTAGTGYDQLITAGTTIAAASQLTLSLGYTPAENEVFTIINNSGGPIAGTFANLPDGGSINAVFEGTQWTFTADYEGGTGNDLTLTAVPEPSAALSLLGGLAALVGMRRFRYRASAAGAGRGCE